MAFTLVLAIENEIPLTKSRPLTQRYHRHIQRAIDNLLVDDNSFVSIDKMLSISLLNDSDTVSQSSSLPKEAQISDHIEKAVASKAARPKKAPTAELSTGLEKFNVFSKLYFDKDKMENIIGEKTLLTAKQ